jgi:2-hydroxy-3-keto-5-methylthiopentenyl-1-phosphate phosphatase
VKKLLIQCDFDGTILEEDISFMILEKYAHGDWHIFNEQYNAGKINVAEFNKKAFGLVKATYEEQMEFIKGKDKLRPGFRELIELCKTQGIKFVVVSNGFDFYIEYIFNQLGLTDIEYHAAKVRFNNSRMHIYYINYDGRLLQSGFKDSYADKYIVEGYDIIYIGDGTSDLAPAKKCRTVFACKSLEDHCRQAGLPYMPFNDFYDIISYLKSQDV